MRITSSGAPLVDRALYTRHRQELQAYRNVALMKVLDKLIAGLTGRQQHIIELRYYKGKTYEEIAEFLGFSEGHIRDLARLAIKRLRYYSRLKLLEEFKD